jgi:hypothetical protein
LLAEVGFCFRIDVRVLEEDAELAVEAALNIFAVGE